MSITDNDGAMLVIEAIDDAQGRRVTGSACGIKLQAKISVIYSP